MNFAFFALAAFFSLALICFGDNVGWTFAAFLGFAFCLDFASCLGFEFVLLFCESFLTAGVLVTLLDTDVLFVFLVSESLSELPHWYSNAHTKKNIIIDHRHPCFFFFGTLLIFWTPVLWNPLLVGWTGGVCWISSGYSQRIQRGSSFLELSVWWCEEFE